MDSKFISVISYTIVINPFGEKESLIFLKSYSSLFKHPTIIEKFKAFLSPRVFI